MTTDTPAPPSRVLRMLRSLRLRPLTPAPTPPSARPSVTADTVPIVRRIRIRRD